MSYVKYESILVGCGGKVNCAMWNVWGVWGCIGGGLGCIGCVWKCNGRSLGLGRGHECDVYMYPTTREEGGDTMVPVYSTFRVIYTFDNFVTCALSRCILHNIPTGL